MIRRPERNEMPKRIRILAKEKAPSAAAQKRAFEQAMTGLNESLFGELKHQAHMLLVSKGGKKSVNELFDKLHDLCDGYPMDVVTAASLNFAGNVYAGYIAFLNLHRMSGSKKSTATNRK